MWPKDDEPPNTSKGKSMNPPEVNPRNPDLNKREPEQIPADLFNITLTIVAALHGLQGNRDSDIPASVDTISSAMRIAKQLKAAGHVK